MNIFDRANFSRSIAALKRYPQTDLINALATTCVGFFHSLFLLSVNPQRSSIFRCPTRVPLSMSISMTKSLTKVVTIQSDSLLVLLSYEKQQCLKSFVSICSLLKKQHEIIRVLSSSGSFISEFWVYNPCVRFESDA